MRAEKTMVAERSVPRRTVLVVESDPARAAVVSQLLRLAGFEVHEAFDVRAAQASVLQHRPSVVVLETALPDGSGFDLALALRAANATLGLLFLSAEPTLEQRLFGFAVGGDDFVAKPFGPAELVARIGALHRRVAMAEEQRRTVRPAPSLTVGDVVLDRTRHEVAQAGRRLDLTRTEFRVLQHLMSRLDHVVTKEEIVEAIWGHGHRDRVNPVEKSVSQVRRKLGGARSSLIETVRGVGYIVRSAP